MWGDCCGGVERLPCGRVSVSTVGIDLQAVWVAGSLWTSVHVCPVCACVCGESVDCCLGCVHRRLCMCMCERVCG